jgi:hypothetical protein
LTEAHTYNKKLLREFKETAYDEIQTIIVEEIINNKNLETNIIKHYKFYCSNIQELYNDQNYNLILEKVDEETLAKAAQLKVSLEKLVNAAKKTAGVKPSLKKVDGVGEYILPGGMEAGLPAEYISGLEDLLNRSKALTSKKGFFGKIADFFGAGDNIAKVIAGEKEMNKIFTSANVGQGAISVPRGYDNVPLMAFHSEVFDTNFADAPQEIKDIKDEIGGDLKRAHNNMMDHMKPEGFFAKFKMLFDPDAAAAQMLSFSLNQLKQMAGYTPVEVEISEEEIEELKDDAEVASEEGEDKKGGKKEKGASPPTGDKEGGEEAGEELGEEIEKEEEGFIGHSIARILTGKGLGANKSTQLSKILNQKNAIDVGAASIELLRTMIEDGVIDLDKLDPEDKEQIEDVL